jgi:uncharacterized protein (TIGR00255 family)
MASSMTGYARVQSDSDALSLALTLRSVNHRFLDLQLRIPADLEAYESLIRQRVKERVTRGQLQISASLRWNDRTERLRVNRALVEAYLESYREMAREHHISAEPDLNAILRLPGAVQLEEGDEVSGDRKAALEAVLDNCLIRALDELARTRQREGEGIIRDIAERGGHILREVEQLESSLGGTTAQIRERIQKRVAELIGEIPLDPQRTLQEAAILADRTDISEELQRLKAHTARLLEMAETEGELGKQVDFLAQEMNREINTMLSKTNPLGSVGLGFTGAALRVKSEIEKIREQAQNLE